MGCCGERNDSPCGILTDLAHSYLSFSLHAFVLLSCWLPSLDLELSIHVALNFVNEMMEVASGVCDFLLGVHFVFLIVLSCNIVFHL